MEMPLVTIATHAVLPCCSLSLSIAPGDYDVVNTTLIFLFGTAHDGQICMDIIISDEELVELDENFLLKADSPDPNVNIMNTATVTIINTDGRWFIVVCNLVPPPPPTHTHRTSIQVYTRCVYSLWP